MAVLPPIVIYYCARRLYEAFILTQKPQHALDGFAQIQWYGDERVFWPRCDE